MLSRTNSIILRIAVFLFFVFIQTFVSSLFAQQRKFTLMGRDYRFERDKWYTYFQGRIGDEIIPDRIIVRLADRGDMKLFHFDGFDFKGVFLASRRILDGFYVLAIDKNRDPFLISNRLEQTSLFDIIEFDAYGQNADMAPDDPLFTNQWNLKQGKLELEKAWSINSGNSDIILAIIDNGAKYDHEDLIGNIWVNPAEDRNGNGQPDFSTYPLGDLDNVDNDSNGFTDGLLGWDFASNDNLPSFSSHGTRVAGVAAAQTNNSIGVAGIAGGWDTQKGVSLMILDDVSPISEAPSASAMADAIDYAINNGADVINISQIFNSDEMCVREAVNDASGAGIVVVCAAGNDGDDPLWWPARYSSTLAVGATTQTDERWSIDANEGSMIGDFDNDIILDVMAPGPASGVWTTNNNGGYTSSFGKTSAATPHVAGVAALMLSADPTLTRLQVRSILKQTAEKVIDDLFCAPTFSDDFYGFGRVNAYAAVSQFPSFRCDVEPNRIMNVTDIIRTIDIILGIIPNPTPFQEWAADCNNDSNINVGDVNREQDIACNCSGGCGGSSSSLMAGGSPTIVSDLSLVSVSKGTIESSGRGILHFSTSITDPIFAVQLFIGMDTKKYETEIPQLTGVSRVMRVKSNVLEDEIRIVMYDPDGIGVKLNEKSFLSMSVRSLSGREPELALEVREAVFVTTPESGTVASLNSAKEEVGVSEKSDIPKAVSLGQNYPNPFNPSTTIRFGIPEKDGLQAMPATLKIYDARGRLVKTLIDENLEPDSYSVHWDGTNGKGGQVSSGTYFYAITAADFSKTKKMVILK